MDTPNQWPWDTDTCDAIQAADEFAASLGGTMTDTPETRAARIVWLLRENCLDACTDGLFGRLENTIAREIREAVAQARAEQREEDALKALELDDGSFASAARVIAARIRAGG